MWIRKQYVWAIFRRLVFLSLCKPIFPTSYPKDTSIELPSVLWDTGAEKEPQETDMEVESTNGIMVPAIIPDLFPVPMNSPQSCDDDSGNEEYSMEIEPEKDSYEKKNHTWEETATQLQLPISTTEMSQYVIPDHWLTADEYQQLLFDMERGNGMYPLYDLGIDNHQVTISSKLHIYESMSSHLLPPL